MMTKSEKGKVMQQRKTERTQRKPSMQEPPHPCSASTVPWISTRESSLAAMDQVTASDGMLESAIYIDSRSILHDDQPKLRSSASPCSYF